ncbi:MAG: TetR/AcrR family transcriptional regulator [Polyangiaceae bacterium]
MNLAPARLPRRRDEARALFRNAILDAAEIVFAERGFHGARIQDIAERARIAVGTVYNHFKQKDDVLSALLEERMGALLERVRSASTDPRDFRPRLEARLARMFTYVEEHRAFFAIANEHGLFAGTAAPGARSAPRNVQQMETFRKVFRAIVREGIASGALESLDARALALFLAATMRAFVLSSLSESGSDAPSRAATMVDLFLHGAGRRGIR